MRIIEARNVHQALPQGIELLTQFGRSQGSRNGSVLVMPSPVTTVYTKPLERVVFWPQRDFNIAFCLYEALWMLAGRRDLLPLTRYVKDFGKFSDDGHTLHGAYGDRWRVRFGFDQLGVIAKRLALEPLDRRCVLQIWDADEDLDNAGKDVPCNDTVVFGRGIGGELNMTVFCRSNDIIWGAYFANAFHFGMLLEYMAHWIGCEVGTYTQVSVNYHGYTSTLTPLKDLPKEAFIHLYSVPRAMTDPYQEQRCHVSPMTTVSSHERVDELIGLLLEDADAGFPTVADGPEEPWARNIYAVLLAHETYRDLDGKSDSWRFTQAFEYLYQFGEPSNDWVVAMANWLGKRQARFEASQAVAK